MYAISAQDLMRQIKNKENQLAVAQSTLREMGEKVDYNPKTLLALARQISAITNALEREWARFRVIVRTDAKKFANAGANKRKIARSKEKDAGKYVSRFSGEGFSV